MSNNRRKSTQDDTSSKEKTPSPSHAPRLPVPELDPSVGVQDIHVPHTTRQSSVDSVHMNQQISDIRPLIRPRGEGFEGSKDCVNTITQSFKKHFVGPYPTFSDVPNNVKDMWFQDFCKSFRWDEIDSVAIRKNWEGKCRKRLSDHLSRDRVRYAASCPPWIDVENWQKLLEHWQKDEFKKISTNAKRNRAVVGPSHTGGSISFTEHENRARQQEGGNFQYQELFERLHVFQSGPKKGEFVNERSKKALEDVNQLRVKYTQSSSSSHSVGNIPSDKELFVEACGGVKKGRAFGLGSETSSFKSKLKATASSSISPGMDKIQKKLFKVQEKVKKYKTSNSVMVNYLKVLAQSVGGPPLPPGIVVDDDDDDDDDGDDDITLVDQHPSTSTARDHHDSPPPSGSFAPPLRA